VEFERRKMAQNNCAHDFAALVFFFIIAVLWALVLPSGFGGRHRRKLDASASLVSRLFRATFVRFVGQAD
jgi:hypothetical protein